MNITDEELAMLEESKNELEWNAACDKIKKARGNSYPPDWWALVMMTGMMGRIQARWGGDAEIKIESF